MGVIWTIIVMIAVGIAFAWYVLLNGDALRRTRNGAPPILSEIATVLSFDHVYEAILAFVEQTPHLITQVDTGSGAMMLSSSTTQFNHGFRFPIRVIPTNTGTTVEVGVSSFGATPDGQEWYERQANRRLTLSLSKRILEFS